MQGRTADGRTLAREAYFLEFARDIAAIANMPVMTTGGIRRPAGTVSQPQSSGNQNNIPAGNGGTIRQPQPAAPAGRPAPGAPANPPSAKPEGRPAPPSGSPTNDRG